MDSFYWQKMENEQQGSVNLLPPSGSASGGAPSVNLTVGDWLLSEQLGLPPPLDATSEEFNNPCIQQFMSGMVFERPNITARPTNMSVEDGVISNTSGHLHHKIEGEEMNRSYGTSSQIPQTSSAVLPTAIKTSPIVSNGSLLSHGCMHISSSQTPGNKRRKGLAKKVVCIPAPCATTSRPGEVVPSDLWAWRKYGQKSIKGSPYPRAYYRCSSSKGCSAKKQVERSRTNPRMLIITYMSEHNHPWPTQHNALAGSTTFHPSKTSFSASNNSSNSQIPPTILKEELNNSIQPSIQVEVQEMEKAMDLVKDNELEEVFHQRYECNQSIDFLAEFKGLVPDPMSLIFSKGLVVDKPYEDKDSKDLDSDKHFECEVSSILEKQRGTSHNKGLDPEPYK